MNVAKTSVEIITDIKFYIAQQGGRYSDWYVGVGRDAKDKLFCLHKVDEQKDVWIYRRAVSSDVAFEVEDHFVNTFRSCGGLSGIDKDADMVYAYKKSTGTKP